VIPMFPRRCYEQPGAQNRSFPVQLIAMLPFALLLVSIGRNQVQIWVLGINRRDSLRQEAASHGPARRR
jgi:hypothetical protein